MTLENIRKYMKQRNIGNKELSEKSGVPLGTLNKIIYGETPNPTVSVVRSIAHALGLTLDELLEDEDTKEEKDELTEYLDELHKRPEMKMLFKVASKATKEDVEKAVKIIEMFKGNSSDGDDI